MKIENKIRKKIKTISLLTGEYPKEIDISEEEYKELGEIDKIDGVKLNIKK